MSGFNFPALVAKLRETMPINPAVAARARLLQAEALTGPNPNHAKAHAIGVLLKAIEIAESGVEL